MYFFQAVQLIISGVWDFFTEIEFPGLGVTIAQLTVGLFLAVLGIRLLSYLFGFQGGGGDSPRTSSTRRPRISKRRERDEF